VVSSVGALEKYGAGKLSLTGNNAYRGATSIAEGVLALQGAGSLGELSPVAINTGATLDISAASTLVHDIGPLSGGGSVSLGANRLTMRGTGDSTFSGAISGSGGLKMHGSGTLTLTGVNDYTGATSIGSGTLALAGAGRLNRLGSVSVAGVFDIAQSSSDQEVGSISGAGHINLGVRTLTVGANDADSFFTGTIAGSGGLNKTGSGALNLRGDALYRHHDACPRQHRRQDAQPERTSSTMPRWFSPKTKAT
jgi:fibronectin-binding autotransporter adhesin